MLKGIKSCWGFATSVDFSWKLQWIVYVALQKCIQSHIFPMSLCCENKFMGWMNYDSIFFMDLNELWQYFLCLSELQYLSFYEHRSFDFSYLSRMHETLIQLLKCQWPLAVNWGTALDTKYVSSQIAAFITRHLWYVLNIHWRLIYFSWHLENMCCRREPWVRKPILCQGWSELRPFKEANTISIANERGSQFAVRRFFKLINDKSSYSASHLLNFCSAFALSHLNNHGCFFKPHDFCRFKAFLVLDPNSHKLNNPKHKKY